MQILGSVVAPSTTLMASYDFKITVSGSIDLRLSLTRACLGQSHTSSCFRPAHQPINAVGWYVFGENHRIIRSMTHELSNPSFHPAGEQPPVEGKGPPQGVILDSFSGPVLAEWDTEAALTPLGQLPFFIDFLKATGLFDAFVADCQLRYTSPKRAEKTRCVGNGDAVDVVYLPSSCVRPRSASGPSSGRSMCATARDSKLPTSSMRSSFKVHFIGNSAMICSLKYRTFLN